MYTEAFELNDDEIIPESLMKYVTRVSFYGNIPKAIHREYGLYKKEDGHGGITVARVEDVLLSLRIAGHTLGLVCDLHDAILAGEIRPYKSFEGEQLSPGQSSWRPTFIHHLKVLLGIKPVE